MVATIPISFVCAACVIVTLRVADGCFLMASILLEVVCRQRVQFLEIMWLVWPR